MLISFKLGQGSIVLRIKIRDSSVSTGAGLTGLTHESAGLIISTIADNEATATAYTQAAGNIETIATLGTYAAPTASKCRFKEVDATNHPGVYEIQIADARFAVSSAKSVIVSISGATNCAETDCLVPLMSFDPYDAVRAGMTALPNAVPDNSDGLPTKASMDSAFSTIKGESYSQETDSLESLRDRGDAAWANTSGLGEGAITYTVLVQKPDDSTPLEDCSVWVSTDALGDTVVAGTRTTNANGEVTFCLDAGTYYFWRYHASYSFDTNPTQLTVS